MKRVAQVMHIAPDVREDFLQRELNPDEEAQRVLWECGVRNQQFYAMSNLVIKSFEYHGSNFREDMAKMSAYLTSKGQLITKRRKDVSRDERDSISWWAPVKKLGQNLTETPASAKAGKDLNWEDDYRNMVSGMTEHSIVDISYNDEDWTSDFHF